ADVFERWIVAGSALHEDSGLSAERARELTIGMLAALEGAFVLARALRTTEPLAIAGELVANAVQAALDES
ncbi:MAG TPA: TetR/AcrR family transcriptional regulator, partial [Solirubrobacteraceae bacterium]